MASQMAKLSLQRRMMSQKMKAIAKFSAELLFAKGHAQVRVRGPSCKAAHSYLHNCNHKTEILHATGPE